MFNKIKYRIENDYIKVYTVYRLVHFFILLSILFLIATFCLIFSVAEKMTLELIIQTFLTMSITFGIIFLFPVLYVINAQIIFDNKSSEIFKKGLFVKKKIMNFEDVHSIELSNLATISGYFIKEKGDKFGRGIFLQGQSNKFQKDVLPAIHSIVFKKSAVAPEKSQTVFSGNFKYFTFSDNKYYVNPNAFKKYKWGLLIFSIIFLGFLYSFFTNQLDEGEVKFIYFSLIPLTIFIGIFSKRTYFDLQNNELIFKFFGITVSKFSLSDFHNFSIIRKTTNGVYNGTMIKLLFRKENGKIKESYELWNFNKTQGIEDFITEAQYIINQNSKH